MFLQYAIPGAMLQLYSVHLKELGLHPLLVGICCATQSLATLMIALLVGQAADRWFSAERCLAVCALGASLVLLLISLVSNFWLILLLTFLFWLMIAPVLMLGTTISFTHLPRPEKEFGLVRMWGTIGWVVPAWILFAILALGYHGTEGISQSLFRIGSLFGLILGFYALTIPRTPPRPNPGGPAAPLVALAHLNNRSFIVYCICMFGVCVTFPFSTQATPLLLQQLQVPPGWLSPVLTISQLTEVITLGCMPLVLGRLGVRNLMIIGLGSWALAMIILCVGQPCNLVITSLGLNGFFITGFLVAGQVFVNQQTTGSVRTSAQALLTFVNGTGNFLGNILIGYLRWIHDDQFVQVFAVAAIMTIALFALFVWGFYQPQHPAVASTLEVETLP